ncbi:LOB domain-containing protein 1-like [Zingiber officinale]|uniref:LOB domain-containing protein 1-like n=1 Tax=Zingiber officinale TaxID=94328 RepID=UPI001C4CEE63|nr:LOB domain-containing protein 1-like [Zingiber officinale]
MEASNAASSASPLHSPCAACKILRRRCSDKCALAPYFPPTELVRFTSAHRVFGASNVVKLLQELAERQRADAVSSLVYEANARIRDPVYGSAGIIFQLQKQVDELQLQLAQAQAELAAQRAQNENLIAVLCMKAWPLPDEYGPRTVAEEYSQESIWEPALWSS